MFKGIFDWFFNHRTVRRAERNRVDDLTFTDWRDENRKLHEDDENFEQSPGAPKKNLFGKVTPKPPKD